MVNATNPDGYSLDTTNLGSKDGEKKDTMSKRTLKTNIIKMCLKVKLVVSMNKHSNVFVLNVEYIFSLFQLTC